MTGSLQLASGSYLLLQDGVSHLLLDGATSPPPPPPPPIVHNNPPFAELSFILEPFITVPLPPTVARHVPVPSPSRHAHNLKAAMDALNTAIASLQAAIAAENTAANNL